MLSKGLVLGATKSSEEGATTSDAATEGASSPGHRQATAIHALLAQHNVMLQALVQVQNAWAQIPTLCDFLGIGLNRMSYFTSLCLGLLIKNEFLLHRITYIHIYKTLRAV